MRYFTITNTISGHCFGEYSADSPDEALDAMSRDAGYRDFDDACSVKPVEPGELHVAECDPLTDETIRTLRDQAFAVGDAVMGFICEVALGTSYDAAELNDNSCLDGAEQREILAMDGDAARLRVMVAIREAKAQW